MQKKYRTGMYGGKFMPFHKGHLYCVDTASEECEKLYLILFAHGSDEDRILKESGEREDLTVPFRAQVIERISRLYDNVIPIVMDTSQCRNPDGSENWDMETPLVRKVVGDKLDAVYSSEPSYGDYFSNAYPEAEHRLVDPPRIKYPISGTQIREAKNKSDIKRYLIENHEVQ